MQCGMSGRLGLLERRRAGKHRLRQLSKGDFRSNTACLGPLGELYVVCTPSGIVEEEATPRDGLTLTVRRERDVAPSRVFRSIGTCAHWARDCRSTQPGLAVYGKSCGKRKRVSVNQTYRSALRSGDRWCGMGSGLFRLPHISGARSQSREPLPVAQ